MKPKHEFSATIKKAGINPYVDVPKKISDYFGIRGYIPVKGKINGHGFLQTLVPLGNRMHRLFVNTYMRQKANVSTGSRIKIILELDKNPRIVPMPKQLSKALEENKKAKEAFGKLTQSRQKEILMYFNSLKTSESIERNIRKLFNRLLKK